MDEEASTCGYRENEGIGVGLSHDARGHTAEGVVDGSEVAETRAAFSAAATSRPKLYETTPIHGNLQSEGTEGDWNTVEREKHREELWRDSNHFFFSARCRKNGFMCVRYRIIRMTTK